MKRNFGKIKLNEFSKNELDQRKLNALKGGCTCAEICYCPDFLDYSTVRSLAPTSYAYFY